METWRPIEGTKGLIEVSNLGNVKSWLRGKEKRLKPQCDSKGYQRITITVDRCKMTLKVHREVAKAFLANPNNLPQVNHIDGNKSNNSVSNLEWVSNRDNALHAINNGLWDNVLLGTKRENERRKTPVVATNINDSTDVIRFGSVAEAERYFNSRHISDVLNGKRTMCKGYSFKREEVSM